MNSPQWMPQARYLRSYFEAFVTTLNSPNWRDPSLGYPAYIDADSWIDWQIIEELSGNIDSMIKSSYFYRPRNGKLTFGPHWDFDLSLGGIDSRPYRDWNGLLFYGWWKSLFRDPDFWQKWIDRYQELRRSHLSTSNMHSLIDRLTAEVRQAQPREEQRWNLRLRGKPSRLSNHRRLAVF